MGQAQIVRLWERTRPLPDKNRFAPSLHLEPHTHRPALECLRQILLWTIWEKTSERVIMNSCQFHE